MQSSAPSPQNLSLEQQELFVQLLSESHRKLLGYLVSLLGNRHDAEDVLQRASLTMWRRFDTFEIGSDFAAWACTVALYEAKNFRRLAVRSRLHFNDDLVELLAAERVEDLKRMDGRFEALEKCLRKLDQESRSLLEAVYCHDTDIGDLAEQVGRARQTLYNRLNFLRRTLAACVLNRLKEAES